MADPSEDLPRSLRPPLGGDQFTLTYRTQVGRQARISDVARRLDDLDVAIQLGERWGGRIARTASYQGLLRRIARSGPGAVEEAASGLGYRERDLAAMDEWVHMGWRPWRLEGFPYRDPESLVRALADYQAAERLGAPARLRGVTYENPLEVVLTGSGFLIAGTIFVLRMVRDWSSARRTAHAAADQAEAVADEARARARKALTESDILQWFGNEARQGRWHVPPGELLDLVGPNNMTALERLSGCDVELDLPRSLDPGGQGSS